jgi:hypothetical protein
VGRRRAELIDGRFVPERYFFAAALLCLFGVIRSPAPGHSLSPWQAGAMSLQLAAAYFLLGSIVLAAAQRRTERSS